MRKYLWVYDVVAYQCGLCRKLNSQTVKRVKGLK